VRPWSSASAPARDPAFHLGSGVSLVPVLLAPCSPLCSPHRKRRLTAWVSCALLPGVLGAGVRSPVFPQVLFAPRHHPAPSVSGST